VPRGGKVCLPQRPKVSPQQATPLPLPNRLRQPTKQTPPGYILCHPGQACLTRDPVLRGWQSPFATETGGLSQKGNSVASAEQTSAAHETNPNRLHTASSWASLLDPGSSLFIQYSPFPASLAAFWPDYFVVR